MHASENSVFACLETLLKCPNITIELHLIIGRAICNEFLYECPRVLNGNLIWKVEKIALLMCTFVETLAEDNLQVVAGDVAAFVDPLSHFILKFTGASYCSEYIFIRLVYLVAYRFAGTPTLRKMVPQFMQAISWNISSLMANLQPEPLLRRQSPESEAKRKIQLQVIELMEILLHYKKEYYEVVERMATHQVPERVCHTAFAPECSSAFLSAGVSFVRALLNSGCSHLLPSRFVKGMMTSLKASPKKFPHYTLIAREMYKMTEFSQYFTGDMVEVVHASLVIKKPSRKSLKQVLAQQPLREKDIMKCLFHMLSSPEHPYGMVMEDFGRRIERSYENREDMEQVLEDTRYTLDTFAQSISDTMKTEEISLGMANFDFSSLCLDACHEAICAREPPIILSLYHKKFEGKDHRLHALCELLGPHVSPAQLNVPEKLCFPEKEENGANVPFHKAITIFKKFSRKKTPLSKLRVLSKVVRTICDAASHIDLSNKLNADDLMTILAYVILKSKARKLFSESEFIHDFLGKQPLAGEQGYLVTTLQCCCMFICSEEFIELISSTKELSEKLKEIKLIENKDDQETKEDRKEVPEKAKEFPENSKEEQEGTIANNKVIEEKAKEKEIITKPKEIIREKITESTEGNEIIAIAKEITENMKEKAKEFTDMFMAKLSA
jgi:hypothetical protein